MRLNRFCGDDRGLTLIELLVTVTLLTIVIVPISNAMVAYLRNTNATNDRLAASHDAQIAAAYFAQDVQSIGVRDWDTPPFALKQSIELDAPPGTGLFPCGATHNAFLRMAWDDPTTATGRPPVVVVSYVVVGEELHRWRCGPSGGFDDIVVAHNLDSAPACVPTCTVAAQSLMVELKLRVQGSTGNILTVKLFGQRRQTP